MSYKDHSIRHRISHETPSESFPLSSGETLFTIDRKGDHQNLRYGSIDKYKVPKYRTAGYGRLIGLDRRFKIASDSGSERYIDNNTFDPSEKSHVFPLRLRQHSNESSSRLLRPKDIEQQDVVQQQDYIALDGKRRKLSSNDGKAGQDVVRNHRPTDRSNIVRLSSESGSESEASEAKLEDSSDEVDAFEAFKNHPDNKKHIELRSLTERNTQNVSAWLDLINHQERYFLLSAGGSRKALSASQKRVVTDMKVSLYEKAIDVIKDKSERQKLILGLMLEGHQIWDTNKQLQQWKSFLQQNQSIELWYEFLNFQQSSTITFSYERCLDTYNGLHKMVWNLDAEDHDDHSVYIVLRLTRLMYEAGFTERAIAIWQALLEYNLCHSKDGDNSLQAFEAFWESECPRVGETDAKGWHSAVRHEAPTRADEPLPTLSDESLFLDWSRAEAQRSTIDVMPARTLDETIEDDPYRVILFSDVKDYMFQLKTKRGRDSLQQGFLKFCGLPPMYNGSGKWRKWWIDPFLCDFEPGTHLGTLTDTTAILTKQDPSLNMWNMSASVAKPLVAFATHVLTQLAQVDTKNERLAEYVIALQLNKDSKSARKLAKALLKTRPDSILLYNAYALVEVRNNKMDVADNVWSTALSMTTSFASTAHQQRFILWHSWIWELLERQQHARALDLLVRALPAEALTTAMLQAAEETPKLSSGQRLRADAYLREEISKSLIQKHQVIVELTSLLAMLKYLQSDSNLDVAMTVYQSTLLLLSKQGCSETIERVHQLRARFLHAHATSSKTGYRPMQIVSILETSMLAFPDNSMFANLHEKYLRRAGTIDRVRLHGIEEASPTSPMMLSLYNIHKELSRPEYSGSTTHSVRHAFANATVTDSRARHCAAMWAVWMKWEISQLSAQTTSRDNNKQFKDVYLSALRSCPWRKDLYLQGFIEPHTTKAVGERELEQVYRSMSERGLRVRHDITDTLDDMT